MNTYLKLHSDHPGGNIGIYIAGTTGKNIKKEENYTCSKT